MIDQQSDTHSNDASDLSLRTHRRLIGYLGFLLPFLVYLLSGLRPTNGLPRWHFLHSISAYYYTGAVAVFVGILFALALFLFSYRGYTTSIADRVIGKVGGTAALGVAICPTKPPDGVTPPSWWHPALGVIHLVSASVLFIAFILFALWLFRKSSQTNRKNRPNDKKVRDMIYLGCAVIMMGAIGWATASIFTGAPIFWQETAAIEGFAISWLVKGEAHAPAVRAIRNLRALRM